MSEIISPKINWTHPEADAPDHNEGVDYRVLVVDDNAFSRMSVVSALENEGVEVVAACADSATALKEQERTEPNAAILDLDLGQGPTGLDLGKGLRKKNPAIGIVFLTNFSDPRLVVSPGQQPPLGAQYVLKNSVTEASILLSALGRSFGPFKGRTKWPTYSGELPRLTAGQLETLKLLAGGYTNQEIARRRSVGEKSVEKTIARIAKHFGVSDSGSTNQRVSIARAYFRQFQS
jgi:DNA-binding NarL/FixJ family response regulator